MRNPCLFNSKLYYVFLHFIVFFYLFSIQFGGMPMNIGTRVVLSIFGLLFLVLIFIKKGQSFSINRKILSIVMTLFCISFVSFIAVLYNGTKDFEFFFKYQVSIILILLASWFVLKLISYKEERFEFQNIINLIINVALIQVILSIIMFFYHPLGDFLNSTQVSSDLDLKLLEKTHEFRLVGFGSKFFGSGVINGFALILIASILKFDKISKKNIFRYSLSFLLIFALGMMMARTTLVGALLAFGILFYPKRKISIKTFNEIIRFILNILILPFLFLFVVFFLFPSLKESLELVFNFGFELFINYFDSGNLQSASTNRLGEMYVWPIDAKTYLIGDGLYTDVINEAYYMSTDVGIIRLLYYSGVLGLVLFIFLQMQVMYFSSLNNKNFRLMFIVIFFYFFILSFKGFTDLVFLSLLFFFRKTNLISENNSIT